MLPLQLPHHVLVELHLVLELLQLAAQGLHLSLQSSLLFLQ